MGLLEGKVAIITGAGGGLGRAYAHYFAREGARILVNDLGGSRDGKGSANAAADKVVAEIEAAGGTANANYANVAAPKQAAAMIDQALDTWGRIDILVNNAGILRDKTLLKLEDENWDAVVDVHLKGTYLCTKHAATAMRELGNGGRIINTTSVAGLQGNFGQANYSAAKAGIWGFSLTAALELKRYGITVNCVAPIAKTRLTEELAQVPEEYAAEDVAPLVAFLASELATDVTGRTFGVHGKQVFEYTMELTRGVTKSEGDWTPSEIAGKLPDIGKTAAQRALDDSDPSVGDGNALAPIFHALPGVFRPEKARDWVGVLLFDLGDGITHSLVIREGECKAEPGAVEGVTCTVKTDASTLADMFTGKLDPNQAFMAGKVKADNLGEMMKFGKAFDLKSLAAKLEQSVKAPASITVHDEKKETPAAAPAKAPEIRRSQTGMNLDLVGKTYALREQFATPEHIHAYALATNDPNPRYSPEHGVEQMVAPPLFVVAPLKEILFTVFTDSDLGMNFLMLVHGEQDISIHEPIRAWDLICPRAEITSIDEKETGDVVTIRCRAMVDGYAKVEAIARMFVRTGKRGSGKNQGEEPQHDLLFKEEMAVTEDQSQRYAGPSGDDNPIHIDPETAKAAGLPGIILQGLCTMAFTSQAVVKNLCDGSPERLRRIAVRFSKPVLMGDHLWTQGWSDGEKDGRKVYGFETWNQRGERVISSGIAEVI